MKFDKNLILIMKFELVCICIDSFCRLFSYSINPLHCEKYITLQVTVTSHENICI